MVLDDPTGQRATHSADVLLSREWFLILKYIYLVVYPLSLRVLQRKNGVLITRFIIHKYIMSAMRDCLAWRQGDTNRFPSKERTLAKKEAIVVIQKKHFKYQYRGPPLVENK